MKKYTMPVLDFNLKESGECASAGPDLHRQWNHIICTSLYVFADLCQRWLVKSKATVDEVYLGILLLIDEFFCICYDLPGNKNIYKYIYVICS